MTTANQIKGAIATLIASQNLAGIPQTTLTAQANAGATTLSVTPLLDAHSRPRFRPGGYLSFYDGLGEKSIPIASVSDDGATITLNCTGLKDGNGTIISGLQYTHPLTNALGHTTTVYSNVGSFHPWTVSAMVELGDPAIAISARRKRTSQQGTGFGFPTYTVVLQYHRLYKRPEDLAGMDPNLWAEEQEIAAWSDLETIETTLLRNPQLTTDFTPACALKLAPLGQSTDLVVTDMDWRPVQGDTWQLTGVMTLQVAAQGQSYR